MSRGNAAVTRFRHHPARAIAGVVVAISLTTLAAVSPWYALLVVVPLVYTVWVWRSGTDVDASGVRVRALLGERRIPWSEITGLARLSADRVAATLRGGGAVRLTAVTPDALPRLVAAGGHRLVDGAGDPGDGATDKITEVGEEVVGNPANGRYGGPTTSG